ncbi:MAG: rhamnose ABC transporter substrate-binding protein [Aestuariivirga sp.]
MLNMKTIVKFGCLAAVTSVLMSGAAFADAVMAKPGAALNMTFLPKFSGNIVFDQAHQGAEEAAKELGNTGKLTYVAPPPTDSVAGQIEMMTNATTQKQAVIMLSNNAGDQVAPAAEAAQKAGTKVVTWDSPIPSGKGESVFVAQVDFGSIGVVMADMALETMGGSGDFAVLSATPDAANQNAWIAAMKETLKGDKYKGIKLVDVVYGDDQSEKSYNAALALVDKHKDLKLIMSPTTVGIVAAAKAMTDEKLCDKTKVSGLGLPSDMVTYTKAGCAPEFALWSFVDLGYLTYQTAYALATGAIKGDVGEEFKAGRMGSFKIEEDPGRKGAKRILMGPFTVYNKDNVEKP